MQVASRDRLDQRIGGVTSRFSGKLGFAAKNLATGEEVVVDADTMYPTASVIKVVILAEVFAQAEEGRLRLDERIEVRPPDVVLGSGVLRDLMPGLQPTVHDLAMLMVIVSDNTATNMLIDRVGGVDVVNQRIHEAYGVRSVVLRNRIDFEKIGDDVRRLAEATPRGLMQVMELMETGRLVSAQACAGMHQIMSRQLYLDQVPRYFSYNPFIKELQQPDDFTVACKTGFFPGTRVDTGVIRTPAAKIVYAAMAHGSQDTGMSVENEAAIANGVLGRLVLEYWWPEATARGAVLPSPYFESLAR
jgi:beta-lactamase class A